MTTTTRPDGTVWTKTRPTRLIRSEDTPGGDRRVLVLGAPMVETAAGLATQAARAWWGAETVPELVVSGWFPEDTSGADVPTLASDCFAGAPGFIFTV